MCADLSFSLYMSGLNYYLFRSKQSGIVTCLHKMKRIPRSFNWMNEFGVHNTMPWARWAIFLFAEVIKRFHVVMDSSFSKELHAWNETVSKSKSWYICLSRLKYQFNSILNTKTLLKKNSKCFSFLQLYLNTKNT